MNPSPNSTIRIPRGLIEHPPALTQPGKELFAEFKNTSGTTSHSLKIGKVDRWQRTPPTPGPGLTLENISILFALIQINQSFPLSDQENPIPISYNQIFKIITPGSSSCSSHHREKLKKLLAELSSIDVLVQHATHPTFEPLITVLPTHSAPVFGRATPAFNISFSKSFHELICDTHACIPFNMESFFSLRSRYARALALFLPTWTSYHKSFSPQHPFKITLSRLIEHLGLPIPKYRAQRRAFFEGHRKDTIFSSIQNLETAFGQLNIRLEDAISTHDDCLCLWLENSPYKNKAQPNQTKDPLSRFKTLKIYQAWNESGRPSNEFIQKVQETSRLSPFDQETLKRARISVSNSERFLTMAKKLVTPRTWEDLIGEAKYAANTQAPPKNPTAKLIGELLSAIRTKL